MRYTFFVLLRASQEWLRLTRDRRQAMAEEHLSPLLVRYPEVSMRFFDAEAFTTLCSDVLMLETDDPKHYYFFIEGLRDSPLITQPYFEVMHYIPAIEQGFEEYASSGLPVSG